MSATEEYEKKVRFLFERWIAPGLAAIPKFQRYAFLDGLRGTPLVDVLTLAEEVGWRFVGFDGGRYIFRRIDSSQFEHILPEMPTPGAVPDLDLRWTVIGKNLDEREMFVRYVTASSAERAKRNVES